MDDLRVHFDLCPVGGSQHLLPDKSDVFKAGGDFIVVQLQPLVLQTALRRCDSVDTDPSVTPASSGTQA